MKKSRKIALLVLSSFLASCGGGLVQPSSIESIRSETSVESVEPSVPSSEPSSEISVDEPTWDDDIKEALIEVVGTAEIPYYEAENYEFEAKTQTGDSGSTQKYLQIDCYPVDWGKASKAYKSSCENEGFTVYEGGTDPLAYKYVSKTDTLYIQYYVTKESFTLTLLVYRITERYAEWPSEDAKIVCGGEVPMIEADSYTASLSTSSVGTPSLTGLAYGVTQEKVDAYAAKLMNLGWTVTEDASYYVYYADNASTGVRIMFYYDDGAMEYLAYNTNIWKYGVHIVKTEYGFKLPDPNWDNIESYYADVTLSDGSTVFTLYLDNVSETNFQTYLAQLYADGWKDDPTASEYATETYKYLVKTIYGKEHSIGCLYSEAHSMIAMPIYC